MIEAGKFLTVALATIAGLLALGYLCLGNVLLSVSWAVVGCILIAMHIALDVESKQ
jgi:hypothetical protein